MQSGSIAVYDALEEFYSLHGHSPGIPWICERIGFVKSTVAHHLDRLEQAGWIIREHKKAHAIVPMRYPRVYYVDRTVGLYAVEPYDQHAIDPDSDGGEYILSDTHAERCPICLRHGCDAPHRYSDDNRHLDIRR